MPDAPRKRDLEQSHRASRARLCSRTGKCQQRTHALQTTLRNEFFYSAAGRSSSSGAVFDFTSLSAIARAASLAVSHK